MRLLSASLVLLAASVGAATQAATPKEYAACSPQQSTQYFSALSNEVAQCQKSSAFDLAGGALPSTAQRAAVCKCSALLQQLPNIRVPRCKISLDGNLYKFKDAIESVFVECSGVRVLEEPLPASQAGSGADDETGGEADVATPAPTTAAPTNQTTSSASSDNEPSAGSIDELPTTEPTSTEEAKATKAPAAVATPAPTKSGAAMLSSVTVVTLATSAVAVAALFV